MDKKKLIRLIEEDLQVLSETLGNFSRMSIYNPYRKDFIAHTKKDIGFMLDLHKKHSQ